MTFSLVRDDGERIDGDVAAYRDGDRFKVLVTCPPAMHASFDVLVFDDTGASFPLAHSPPLACGNDVPLPGAFRLTGSGEELVCVVWLDLGGPPAERLSTSAPGHSGPSRCKRLGGTP